MDVILPLAETSPLWLPGLTLLAGRAGATRPGRAIEAFFKDRLGLLKDATTERAFVEAFAEGAHRYERAHGDTPAGKAVILVMRRVAEGRETSQLDQARVLAQIFAARPDMAELALVVRRYAPIIAGITLPLDAVETALGTLVRDYLRPAFLAQPQFAERVGSATMIGLLQDILDTLREPVVDFDRLRTDYLTQQRELYKDIMMHGISPKVNNRMIGIAMEEVFIALEMELDAHNDARTTLSARWLGWIDAHAKVDQARISKLSTESGDHDARTDLSEPLLGWDDLLLRADDDPHIGILQTLAQELDGSGEERIPQRLTPHSVARIPRSVIKGHPGSGKSTLTRYLTWAIAAGKTELIGERLSTYLPIRIRAIEFGEALKQRQIETLEEYLIEQAGRFAALVKEALLLDRALVLIDGLDEISERALRQRVKQRVDAFVADPAFANNRMVITTRIVGYERSGVTGRFPHFTIAELNDQQIDTFVTSWYRAIQAQLPSAIEAQRERAELLNAITASPSIQRMARNPLLLTIIALMKQQIRKLPDRRVQLYDAVTQTLISSWPEVHRGVELEYQFTREWLAPVAHQIFAERTSDTLDEYILMDLLVTCYCKLRSAPKPEAQERSKALFDTIAQHSGIMLPRGADRDGRELFGFLHQTFAEYLTACHLAGQWEDGQLDLHDYAHDPYWREVLLLMAGHLGTQRRAKGGEFVRALRNLRSSPYEAVIQRDLLLACRVLGDSVPVGPGALVEGLLRELFAVWSTTTITPLRAAIREVLVRLAPTEYGPVFARIAKEQLQAPDLLIELAEVFGPGQFDDELAAYLTTTDLRVCLNVARALARHNDPRGLEQLGVLVGADSQYIGGSALIDLNKRTDLADISSLYALLEHPDPALRLKVATLLANSGVARAKELVAATAAKGPLQLRQSAALALRGFDQPHGLDALAALAQDVDEETRYHIAQTLEKYTDPRAAALYAGLLDAQEPSTKTRAATKLDELGDPRGIDRLTHWCRGRNPMLRLWAANQLLSRGQPLGMETLVALQRTKNARARAFAGCDLFGHGDARGRKTLLGLLETDNHEIHKLIAAELLHLGTSMDSPVEITEVFDCAARVLADDRTWQEGLWEQVGYNELPLLSNNTLELLARSPDRQLAVRFGELLYESDPARATPILEGLLSSRNVDVRIAAAGLLARHGHTESIAMLVDLLEAEEDEVRWYEAGLLTEVRDPRGLDTLAALLQSSDVAVRVSAARLLFESGAQGDAAAHAWRQRKLERFAQHIDQLLADTTISWEMLFLDERVPAAPQRSCADLAYEFLRHFLTPQGQIELVG